VDLHVTAATPALPLPAAASAVFRPEDALHLEVGQGFQIITHDKQRVAAVAAVAAVGAAPWNVLLSSEMHRPAATVPGANLYNRLVDESALHTSDIGSLGFYADELSPLLFMENHCAFGQGK
jgi:hypothetical protein